MIISSKHYYHFETPKCLVPRILLCFCFFFDLLISSIPLQTHIFRPHCWNITYLFTLLLHILRPKNIPLANLGENNWICYLIVNSPFYIIYCNSFWIVRIKCSLYLDIYSNVDHYATAIFTNGKALMDKITCNVYS